MFCKSLNGKSRYIVMLQVHNENDTYTFAGMPATVLRWMH
jgi:hypothetical protein